MFSNTFIGIKLEFDGLYYGGNYEIEIFSDGRLYYSYIENDSIEIKKGSFQVTQKEVMIAKIPGRNYDENKPQNIHEKRYDLDEVLEKCDILTLHTPLTELTRNLINLERMKKMKKSSIILNLARGPVINQEDLYFALKNKIIKSAAIDVTSVEPVEKDSKLFELENLLITPHIAWKSEKSLIRLMDNVENNLKMFLEGKLEGLK